MSRILCFTLSTFVLMTISSKVWSQKKLQRLFEAASDYYYDEQYDSAVILYQKIEKKLDWGETARAKATYNIGHIYFLQNKFAQAKEVFTKILNSDFNENDAGGPGSGVMADPYALYKHNACKNLAAIALKEGENRKALEYTFQFDKIYPYRHFCGNEIAENEVYTAIAYAKAYIGLGYQDSALQFLLPYVFPNGLAENDQLVELAIELIKKLFSSSKIKETLQETENSIFLKKGIKYEIPYCKVFSKEISLSDQLFFIEFDPKADKTLYLKKKIKESGFYKKLLHIVEAER